MIVARSGYQLRRAIDSLTLRKTPRSVNDIVRERPRVAFVPTMGSLHAGHISLVTSAASKGDITIASVFVNPTQFAPGEDFDLYPRNEVDDLELLERSGTDIAFLPTVDDVYPPGFSTQVRADAKLTDCLCGESRGAAHFDGVATVVARLFGLVQPDTAWFGEKDWQQLQVIRRMSDDIFPSIAIESGPTIRDSDGLALSSRNARLNPTGRSLAAEIPRAIGKLGEAASAQANATAEDLVAQAIADLEGKGITIDYLEIRHPDTLAPISGRLSSGEFPRVFVAALIDGVRLIDNAPIFNSASQQADRAVTAHIAASTS